MGCRRLKPRLTMCKARILHAVVLFKPLLVLFDCACTFHLMLGSWREIIQEMGHLALRGPLLIQFLASQRALMALPGVIPDCRTMSEPLAPPILRPPQIKRMNTQNKLESLFGSYLSSQLLKNARIESPGSAQRREST